MRLRHSILKEDFRAADACRRLPHVHGSEINRIDGLDSHIPGIETHSRICAEEPGMWKWGWPFIRATASSMEAA